MMSATANESRRPIVLAFTGASGAVYGVRLLQLLLCAGCRVHLVVSESGAAVIRQELKVKWLANDPQTQLACIESLFEACDALLSIEGSNELSTQSARALEFATQGRLMVHAHNDYFTPIASGSFLTGGMVICPCSGSTLSGIAHSASQNLIQRAAEVHLKECRKLIIVPRETPLSVLQLENMHRLAQAGVVVLPASPGWYHDATRLLDLVDFIVARILDQLGVENQQIERWATRGE
jgi:flavin prenyltransferase